MHVLQNLSFLGPAYLVYIVCIIKRVWFFISLVTSSSLTTQLTTGIKRDVHGNGNTNMPKMGM